MRTTTLSAALLLAALPAMAQSAATIATQFFPPALTAQTNDLRAKGLAPENTTAALDADLDGTGRADYVVAAYANGISATVRLLKRANTGATLVDEPPGTFAGAHASLRLLDIDGDHKPEVLVRFSGPQARSADYVFQWRAGKLVVISPTRDGASVIGDAVYEDLDGDGKLDIIAGGASTDTMTIYHYANGSFTMDGTALFYGTFRREKGAPVARQRTITVDRSDIPYILRVVNGENGKNRVSSAEIRLNGALLAGPDQFSQQVATFDVSPVTLLPSNVLAVTVRSAPGSVLSVLILRGPEPHAAAVEPILECIALQPNNAFVAHFGYANPNTYPLGFPVGPDNTFGAPADAGQPVTFLPGRQRDVFHVYSGGGNRTWQLNGRSVIASARADLPCS